MSFGRHARGSEIEVSDGAFGEVLASPKVETFLFRRLSIQLSLDELLSSRARLCLTGPHKLNFFNNGVNYWLRVHMEH